MSPEPNGTDLLTEVLIAMAAGRAVAGLSGDAVRRRMRRTRMAVAQSMDSARAAAFFSAFAMRSAAISVPRAQPSSVSS